MSTRCNVAIKLKEKDLDKVLKVDSSHYFETKKEYPTIEIYIHHDGYPEGVGEGLINELPNDYESVLKYILKGNRTSFETPYIERDEKWEDNRPTSIGGDIWTDDSEIPENYYYLYINDKWYFRKCNESGSKLNWYDLKEYLEKK